MNDWISTFVVKLQWLIFYIEEVKYRRELIMLKSKNKYRFCRDEYVENHHCLQINRLDARSVVIPAQRSGIFCKNKEQSNLLQSLNGDYKFKYCKGDEIPDFYTCDFDASNWGIIDVPSMWQYRGYGKCAYPNVEYPIPFNPPYVCCENPVGYYIKHFELKKTAKTILHFGGVDNAFYVYINGEFVGFSKGSRIPAEFDVTDSVKDGDNLLAVKVFTYSDATYLENQDMLLANGIFRDVYLLNLGEVSLWDYRVTTTYDSITVDAEIDGFFDNCIVRLTLDGEYMEYNASAKVKHTFNLSNPKLWNAEEPNLYDLTIEIIKNSETVEVHSKKVGIMHTEVRDKQFFINKKPVYIKGINRHEYDWKEGRVISVELIEKELKMIKDNNLNAIRCAHYMNNPAFYEIASEIGLYVMEEADIETHGCGVTGDQGYLSKNPDWFDAYFDRISRMAYINKNEPCIFIWSLGNECGRGQNIDKCFEWLKEFDPTKEVIHTQEEPYNPKYSQFSRVGYPSLEMVKSFKDTGKPLMLIEYAHAMGNSPGFLQGYWDYIYSADHVCGGFVWEFKNHGFYHAGNVLYGGDFGDKDKCHWYNFCLDGFLTSDGTPKPTWYELGEVSAPIYVKFDKDIILKNTNDFRDASYLTMKWELIEDYKVVKSGEMKLPEIAPHNEKRYSLKEINCEISEPVSDAKYYIILYFFDGDRKISTKQIELPFEMVRQKYVCKKAEITICQNNTEICVSADDFAVKFDKGMVTEYVICGKQLISAPMSVNFHRTPNDNDGIMLMEEWFPGWFHRNKGVWKQAYLSTMKFHAESITVEESDSAVFVKYNGKIIPDYKYIGFDAVIIYKVYKSGIVICSMHCKPFGKLPDKLPTMGVCFELDKAYSEIEWYGRGKQQNYCDCIAAAPVGLYKSNVEDMNFMFDKPQDTGNREDTTFAVLSGEDKKLAVIGLDKFTFRYQDFSPWILDKAMHKNDIEKFDKNYFYCNYKMRGLGSRSCGPEPEEEFELRPHEFVFAFALSTVENVDEALRLSKYDFELKTEQLTDKYEFAELNLEKEIADCKDE